MKNLLPKLHKTSGFTLIELMVVMTVIAILAAMVLYGLGKAQASARDARRMQSMTGIQAALERYYGDNQAYPSGGYSAMLTTLKSGSYLSGDPIDPGGTAPTYFYESPNGTNCLGSALPNGYQLRFTKESGGPSYFCSPQ